MCNVGSLITRLLSGTFLVWLVSAASALAADNAVAVDCNAGGSINAAINSVSGDDPLVVTVTGICAEFVAIARDNVTVQGATASAGISVPASGTGFFAVTAANGRAQNLTLRSLTINAGDRTGVFCGTGTSVLLDSVTLNAGNGGGVLAIGNSTCRILNSTIQGPGGATTGVGVYATTGAYAELVSTTVDDFYVGVLAQSNSTLLVGSIFGTATISGNDSGMVLEAGASAQVSSAVIENNDSDGIVVSPTASFTVAGPATNLAVRNNGGHGISLRKNSSAVIRYATLTIQGNGGHTVNCESNVGLVLSSIAAANLDGAPNGCN